MIQPWRKILTKPLGDYHIFSLRLDQKVSPRTGEPHDFFIIDCVNWVNVVAITPDKQLVMLEQYRHGSNTVELEVPGGVMDAKDVSPLATGVRELREETGYEGTAARALNWAFANPAIMNNRSHFVIIEQCVHRHACEFDHGEDLLTRLVPWRDIPSLVRAGKIRHPLVVAALYHYELARRTT